MDDRLTKGHARLAALGLASFTARTRATRAGPERFKLSLEAPPALAGQIAEVTYQGWHAGYDENGNLRERDWHGFTQDRKPAAHLGTVEAPFELEWDVSMLPEQRNVAVRAFVRFRDAPGLVYVTAASGGLGIEHPPGVSVQLHRAEDLPDAFWSRAGSLKTCIIRLEIEPERIERAELYVIAWTGGAGTIAEYFKLNGRHLPVAEGHSHLVQYNRLPIDPAWLRRGTNTIELLSDAAHHGLEIFAPGPALMLRSRTAAR